MSADASGPAHLAAGPPLVLDGASLTLDDLVDVARGARVVRLAPHAVARIDAARTIVDEQARGEAPAYGINTGFGSLSDVRIPPEALGELQLNLVRSHAAGVGEPLPVDAVRATMVLRANVLAKGFSGIRRETLERLLALLNARVHPRVPSRGSVGASGDLAPLAHLVLALIGEGDTLDGRTLGQAGLAALTLEAKEGLALINGTQPSTAVLALALHDALRARRCRRPGGGDVDRRAARVGEAVRPAHPRAAAVRGAADGGRGAWRALLEGSAINRLARELRSRPGRLLDALRGAGARRGARRPRLRRPQRWRSR